MKHEEQAPPADPSASCLNKLKGKKFCGGPCVDNAHRTSEDGYAKQRRIPQFVVAKAVSKSMAPRVKVAVMTEIVDRVFAKTKSQSPASPPTPPRESPRRRPRLPRRPPQWCRRWQSSDRRRICSLVVTDMCTQKPHRRLLPFRSALQVQDGYREQFRYPTAGIRVLARRVKPAGERLYGPAHPLAQ
jgi:hypothetical protein